MLLLRALLFVEALLLAGGAGGMKTVGTFEALRSALREREEVVVVSENVVVVSTLFISQANVSLSGSAATTTTWLDGRNSAQLLVVTGESDVLIEDLGLRGGFSSGSGGAVSVLGGASVEIVRCTVTGSSADVGGAVYTSASVLSLVESVFSSNAARAGAAVYASESTLTIEDCNVFSNVASTAAAGFALDDGGGAVVLRTSHAELKRSTFELNRAARGAAVAASRESVLTTFECVFRNNRVTSDLTSTPATGGAVSLDADSVGGLTNTVLETNRADKGGALAAASSSLSTFGCTFTKNSAQLGGAIAVEDKAEWLDHDGAVLDNVADMAGGGLYSTTDAQVHSKHTRFANNFPDQSFVFAHSSPHHPEHRRLLRRKLSVLHDTTESSTGVARPSRLVVLVAIILVGAALLGALFGLVVLRCRQRENTVVAPLAA